VRIISGLYKGRRIQTPSNIKARPTTDFAKEGLFNLLNNRIDFEDIHMLDLFAGTGSIGIEFISRGSASVTSIESLDVHCTFIHKVCAELKISNLQLLKMDVFKFVGSTKMKYDMIFADPPYDLKLLENIPDLIFKNGLLKDDGLFVMEHSSKNMFSLHPNYIDHRAYGNVNFSFFGSKPA
jgi:16S rRNA (guanine(966)-N(2))-methyltransferase RsmD